MTKTERNLNKERWVIKLMGCRGSFQTCDICNNCNGLLRDPSRHWTEEQRDVIVQFKMLHLMQQKAERDEMEINKIKALSDFTDGVPNTIMLVIDGMTKYKGDTPKYGKRRSKGDKTIESRIIGVEVYCGPVKEILVYTTDDLVCGGANIMIEVLRQALIDVKNLLLSKNISGNPKNLILQFDNCSENKVSVRNKSFMLCTNFFFD